MTHVVAVAKKTTKGPKVDGHRSGLYIDQDREQRNYKVPLSAFAVEDQDDAGGGFDCQSAHDLNLHVKNWDDHRDEADDQHP